MLELNTINNSKYRYFEKVVFEYYECLTTKMSFMLSSIPLCLNNNSVISMWFSNTASIKAVILNSRVKFHISFKISIL